ncbi:HAD family hydrolase [Synechococcus sp. CS-1328]|uniref:HAD family hydrolase n=1 Tax=Synechococcus sp. CS-1328 TaxID=2847976 RepID=UPI00223C1297|nr:HAD family hydrolase [Synechococcus sp. CS-1328]MCT0224369.1 HAD hydrolase-like protein [Synechococcus sp. CS-1328]
MNLDSYATIVFDCDGVILDSNRVKTEAFRIAAMPYGEAAAAALVKHHISNGGVSRYVKFAYFLETIVPKHAPHLIPEIEVTALEQLLSSYAQTVRSELMNCRVAEGLDELRAATPSARWLIASGGDQSELRDIFNARGLSSLFDGGIMGSPDTKEVILRREIELGNIIFPALFLGDSRYDHQAATNSGLDFIFVSGWTELKGWPELVERNNLFHVRRLCDLCST